jgi:LPXTG-motif cell wall-anchored protein
MEDVSREVARDCEHPAAQIDASCDERGAVVTFANDGESTTTFTVRKNGDVIDTVEVEGDATDERFYALDEDETATFSISSDGGMDDVEATIEQDCEEPVPPVTPTPVPPAVVPQVFGSTYSPAAAEDNETLPDTGSEPLLIAEAGLGLLLLGSLLVRRFRSDNG